MYSPKIAEHLIPQLYRMAKERHMPMTRLVNGILGKALAVENSRTESDQTVLAMASGSVPQGKPQDAA